VRLARSIVLEEIHCALCKIRFHSHSRLQHTRGLMMCESLLSDSNVLSRPKWFRKEKRSMIKSCGECRREFISIFRLQNTHFSHCQTSSSIRHFHQKRCQVKSYEECPRSSFRCFVFPPTSLATNLPKNEAFCTKKGQRSKLVESAVDISFPVFVFTPPSLASMLVMDKIISTKKVKG